MTSKEYWKEGQRFFVPVEEILGKMEFDLSRKEKSSLFFVRLGDEGRRNREAFAVVRVWRRKDIGDCEHTVERFFCDKDAEAYFKLLIEGYKEAFKWQKN